MKNLIIFILHIRVFWPITALAIQTNVNEVDDLFDRHIEGKDQLLQNLSKQNSNAINQIQSGMHHDSIEGIDAAESKSSELNAIKETDLDNEGRNKRLSSEYQFYDANELEPDYLRPGNILHKQDSDNIIFSTEDTMREIGASFMDKLNKEGFDCKTVKGAVVKEPTYYIEVKTEQQKNTEYEQIFCEELRGNYSCNDTVTLNCTRRDKRWNHWQYREVDISGDTVYHGAKHLGYTLKWGIKRYGWHLQVDSSGWRVFLSNHLGIPLEQIHEQIHFPAGARGVGGTHPVYENYRIVFNAYRFGYNYRDGYEICEEWSEDWNERCIFK